MHPTPSTTETSFRRGGRSPRGSRRDPAQVRALIGPGTGIAAALLFLALPVAAALDPGTVPAPAPVPEAYARLLAWNAVAEATVWLDDDGPLPFTRWPAERRDDLGRAIGRVESGGAGSAWGERPLAGAPDDPWAVYVAHVAHTLWLETGGRVPWSLRSQTPEQLALLLDARELFAFDPSSGHRAGPVGAVADPDPAAGYRFAVAEDLVRASQEETVWAVAAWLRRRASYPDRPPAAGRQAPALRSVEEIVGGVPERKPRLVDCHEIAGLMTSVLRALNIPAAVRPSRLAPPGGPVRVHSRVELPTIGRGLPHAAFLAMPVLRSTGNEVPTPALFQTLAWLRENVDEPRHLQCSGDRCHQPAEQALFNTARLAVDLAVSHLTDGLLARRAEDPGPEAPGAALEALLSGRLARWEGEPFVEPFFDPPERSEILRRVDAAIVEAGDGDWQRGAERVRRRTRRGTLAPDVLSGRQPSDLGADPIELPFEPVHGVGEPLGGDGGGDG